MSAMIFDRPVSSWVVWLSNGSVVFDRWEDAPDGIVAILVLYDRPYARILYGSDYYARKGDSWGQSNDPSELEGAVKSGVYVDDEGWETALNDLNLTLKNWREQIP